jgi:RNA polymerase sigma-70 factor (ECF subfamily)
MANILTFAPENRPERQDEEVIREVLAGEKALYEVLMRRYNRRLYRIGRTYLSSEEDIIDTIQEAYIKAYENLSRFRHESKFSTWLTRIFINECLLKVKHRKRFALTGTNTTPEDYYFNQIKSMDTPEKNMMNKELARALEKAIGLLPEKYRTVFMMRDIEGMSITETSECLDISESNVKVRLNRAKEMLRENISSIYKDAEVFKFDGERCDRIVSFVMGKVAAG